MSFADTVHAFVGAPQVLAVGAPDGPLAGMTLAVKDVIDVADTVTGAGNPTWAATHAPAAAHASAVAALVAAGATVVGKTITDELAYSLSGTNVHLGTPINVAAPGRIPGGSSAGSAAAVAAGLVDLALGTDTGGSIRVPASYCGLVGWRPTHGLVDAGGIVHLARSFDTVGLLGRDPALVRAGARVLLGSTAAADSDAATATTTTGHTTDLDLDLDRCVEAFRVLQGREAWREHGRWITDAKPDLGRGIAARFAAGSRVTDDEVAAAEVVRAEVRAAVASATAGGRILLGPAAGSAAPRLVEPADRRDAIRKRTLRTTCVAGLAGAPVVVLPLSEDDGHPLGVAALGAPGTDLALLAWAVDRMAA